METLADRPTLLSAVSRAASKLDVIFAATSWTNEWGSALMYLLDDFSIEFEDGFVLNDEGSESLTLLECAMLASYVVQRPEKPWTQWYVLHMRHDPGDQTMRAMAFDLADFVRSHTSVRRIGPRRRVRRASQGLG